MTRQSRDAAAVAATGQAGLGGLLRGWRHQQLLAQEQLAERCGLSVRTIRNLEAGRVRRPRAATVRMLAKGLQLAGWEREQFEAAGRPASPVGQPAVPPSPDDTASRQLPPGIADFGGRTEQVRPLRDLLGRALDGLEGQAKVTAVAISVVADKAGVCKTALAVHVAHHLGADLPDGQLYTSLRGTRDGGCDGLPVEAAQVLGRFLRALGAEQRLSGETTPAE
jgi:transcriptional regulator with XRE-family HTH domain